MHTPNVRVPQRISEPSRKRRQNGRTREPSEWRQRWRPLCHVDDGLSPRAEVPEDVAFEQKIHLPRP